MHGLLRDDMNLARRNRFIKKLAKDILPGGLADNKQPKDFNPQQLQKGIKVEMEHTNNPLIAREIAMDHLTEDSEYYNKLELIESH